MSYFERLYNSIYQHEANIILLHFQSFSFAITVEPALRDTCTKRTPVLCGHFQFPSMLLFSLQLTCIKRTLLTSPLGVHLRQIQLYVKCIVV